VGGGRGYFNIFFCRTLEKGGSHLRVIIYGCTYTGSVARTAGVPAARRIAEAVNFILRKGKEWEGEVTAQSKSL
jgi:hypothetical protein